jgi:predicted DNA-binding WGR domain protein
LFIFNCSFFFLDFGLRWYLFRAWGRVGTTIGGNKLETFGNKHDALREFEALYVDKTGNDWESRKYATKIPNKFYPLEMDYGEVFLEHFEFH